MYKVFSFLFLFFFIAPQLRSQIFPKEDSKLNYRLIGFSVPPVSGADSYTIQIAQGRYNDADSFKKNITQTIPLDANKKIIEVPAFGTQYTWRVIYKGSDQKKTGHLYHFTTGTIPEVDPKINRVNILTPAKKYRDAFILADANGVMYDMKGNPLWYLPPTDKIITSDIRDLKLTPFGTLTLLTATKPYEVDYNGNILWTCPDSSKATTNIEKNIHLYHHEFTRLSNGHYMSLATEDMVLCKMPTEDDNTFIIYDTPITKKDNTKKYRNGSFGALIEYDEQGKVVWLWRVAKYIERSDLIYRFGPKDKMDLHDNAFYFDEQNKVICLSFRNISRVIKIKYPEGNVLNTYGNIYKKGGVYKPGLHENGNDLFTGQHAAKYSSKGFLYLFDNDNGDSDVAPKVLVMKEPAIGNGWPEIIWKYTCAISEKEKQMGFLPNSGGGNVIELPDGSFFICMGGILSKSMIVNADKEILWSAFSEKYDVDGKTWKMHTSYRQSIITDRKDLEQLIWNSEK